MSVQHHQPPASLLELAWARYKTQLQKRPLLTKAVTSACIAGVSDVIAQAILRMPYRVSRTLKMMLYGLLWNGPSAHFWQAHLQHAFQHKTDTPTAIAKVVVDQLTYGPLCNLLFMAYTAIVVNGVPASLFWAQLPKTYPNVQMQGWKVWPLAGLINYRYVPLQFRVLFINLVALCWSTFLIIKARAGAGGR